MENESSKPSLHPPEIPFAFRQNPQRTNPQPTTVSSDGIVGNTKSFRYMQHSIKYTTPKKSVKARFL